MFKKLFGRVAAVALAAGVCFGAFNIGNIETKAYTAFSGRVGVQAIQLNKRVYGTIANKGAQKWYQFNTLSSDDYWYTVDFKGAGIYDATLALYDSDGANIKNLESYQDKDSKYVVKLNRSSTYYIQVYAWNDYDYTGDFSLCVSAEADEGNTNETAKPIGSDYSGILAHGDDADVLSFNSGANTATTVTVKNIDGYYSINAQIFNADGTKVDDYFSISTANSKSQTVLLKKNTTYFIKVRNDNYNGRVSYKISISGRKDEPGKRKQAQKVKAKKNVNGVLDTENDEDWFKVKLNKRKNWNFILKNINCDGTAYLTVYKGSRQLAYAYCSEANRGKVKLRLKKGTYYIKITGPQGDYSFKVK